MRAAIPRHHFARRCQFRARGHDKAPSAMEPQKFVANLCSDSQRGNAEAFVLGRRSRLDPQQSSSRFAGAALARVRAARADDGGKPLRRGYDEISTWQKDMTIIGKSPAISAANAAVSASDRLCGGLAGGHGAGTAAVCAVLELAQEPQAHAHAIGDAGARLSPRLNWHSCNRPRQAETRAETVGSVGWYSGRP